MIPTGGDPLGTHLELCRSYGLDGEPARELVLLCGRNGIELQAALAALDKLAVSAATSIFDVAEMLGRALAPHVPLERPDISAIAAGLGERPQNRDERRDLQRRRSMKQPTGMPWDRRR